MPGARITLSDELSPAINAIAAAATHPGDLMASFAAAMLTATQRRFERETDPDGRPWPPLAKRTTMKKVRGKRRGSDHILRETTRLYRSLTTRSDNRSAEIGTNLTYAGIHQFGGEIQQYARSQRASLKKIRNRYRFVRPGTKGAEERRITIGEHSVRIPARPYLGFSAEDVAALTAIGEAWLAEEAAR
ncbi:phage virion morphogenesis protein [Mycoplana ramosa]|uniref:Phage virion morphogenesis protein n=1 Tax=Mycoplana ramosa TaxID=40837 RepID=A0ABW3Z1Z0_MYCRA